MHPRCRRATATAPAASPARTDQTGGHRSRLDSGLPASNSKEVTGRNSECAGDRWPESDIHRMRRCAASAARCSANSMRLPSRSLQSLSSAAASRRTSEPCERVGRVGSNPRPADNESGRPAARCMAAELGRSLWMRSCLPRFRHVLGMIKVAVGRVVWSVLRAVVDLRAMVNIEDVNDAVALVDPINDAIGPAPRTVTTGQGPN